MSETKDTKPICVVRGSLMNGKAMCGYIIVNSNQCAAKGKCGYQQQCQPEQAKDHQ